MAGDRQIAIKFQSELPQVVCERKEKFISKEELCKIMKWKLTRGKFRPRLTELVATNSEDLVKETSRLAFQKLPDVAAAISCLTVLKAVGPATASAVLAAVCPADAPFMADESMLAIPGLQPLAYTLSFYKTYLTEVNKLKKSLNKKDSVKDWTAHKVEKALWTYYVGEQFSPGMFAGLDMSEDKASVKRTASTDITDNDGGKVKKGKPNAPVKASRSLHKKRKRTS